MEFVIIDIDDEDNRYGMQWRKQEAEHETTP